MPISPPLPDSPASRVVQHVPSSLPTSLPTQDATSRLKRNQTLQKHITAKFSPLHNPKQADLPLGTLMGHGQGLLSLTPQSRKSSSSSPISAPWHTKWVPTLWYTSVQVWYGFHTSASCSLQKMPLWWHPPLQKCQLTGEQKLQAEKRQSSGLTSTELLLIISQPSCSNSRHPQASYIHAKEISY